MQTERNGARIAKGLEFWPDDQEQGRWRIIGEGWNANGSGDAGQLTELALAILEMVNDNRELPAVDPEQEHGALCYITTSPRIPPGEDARVGGALIAKGVSMIRGARQKAWEQGRREDLGVRFGDEWTRLPFRIEVESETPDPGIPDPGIQE